MLQHLRFHRRAPSNPTSPVPESSPWDTASLQPAQLVPEDRVPAPDIRPRSATSVPFAHGHGQTPPQPTPPPQQQRDSSAPTLPPITRVVSADSTLSLDLQSFDRMPETKTRGDSKPLPRSPARSPYNEQSGFIGGLALENYRREQVALKPNSSDNDNSGPRPNSSVTSPSIRPPLPAKSSKTSSSFVSPTELHHAPLTGKRPPGARMNTEPQNLTSPPSTHEAPRTRKSLPFLKNPMSTLLLRRKTSQNIPDLTLPLKKEKGEPSYDPRIRGTRVHDFSAPRQRKTMPVIEQSNMEEVNNTRQDQISPVVSGQSQGNPGTPAPPVPPKDEELKSSRASSSTHSKTLSIDTSTMQKSRELSDTQSNGTLRSEANSQRRKSAIPSSVTSISRNASEASTRDVLSSLPKHMKSTSSRFSFDMIGAAKQEKLLEERHRQRQQDKQAEEQTDRRDSRYDDFDEDAFDYDAMDYDDGLEERIPGVNADYEEEEDFDTLNDPDNDQENFAGFVFQRSGPTSELASPKSAGIIPTPRDANGNVIGYAMTGETPELEQHAESSLEDISDYLSAKIPEEITPTGLGIQGLGVSDEAVEPLTIKKKESTVDIPRPTNKDDELYFSGGMDSFAGEGDGSAFDESIFDLDDTDQYGRPIPGMFANALAQRNAEEEKKRESDITSRLSAQTGVSESTAHTSLSVDNHAEPSRIPEPRQDDTDAIESQAVGGQSSPTSAGDPMAAYQAALAAAACNAAASGKFRRDSSPPPVAELTITSPTTSGSSHSHPDAIDDTFGDLDFNDDDGFSGGLDDYELDDDAIIAEANASALANDSDGWYGQEFGFYSAPVSMPSHHSPSSLSEKNLYQYSHGGYFGPGVNRSTSGRVVSREPNLTPITERSEYSNRNSLMSLGVPPGPSSAGALQSPGLAQLAMMADDDNMSLSALLRLRSKAWGSQVSLPSSRDGSPNDRNGASSPWGQDYGNTGPSPSHGRKNSAFSLYSQESAGAGSASGSPTLTMSVPTVPTQAIPPLSVPSSNNANSNAAVAPLAAPVFSPLQQSSPACPPVLEDDEMKMSPTSPSVRRLSETSMSSPIVAMRPGIMGHRHKGSADSISYTTVEESGETKWVLERRRTSESGEVEIAREVQNGRI
ncbi:hypothetical protein F5Y15DRAFT_389818 [Xylariaceae sp. FL0016]|nr:hypothetical protein F5Y15DRAFT_389818 [Xylariaceae sp. FL0016]